MHIIKGQAYTVHERIDYAMNPTKTRRGELVMAYGCDRATTAAEMLLSKRNYIAFTGMATTQKDVLLYQIRQSFKPGEITPEQAQFAFRAPGQQKFTHLRSLGDGYSEQEIRAVIADKTPLSPSRSKAARQEPQRVHLLVDIQAKGPGYERWAKIFNLKQMAQAMNFLTENNLLEYAELEEKATAAATRFNELSARIKAAETRMAEIGNLKAHIVNYSKTRDVYTTYRKAGYSKKFYEANASGILLHKAAKAAFATLPGKKIPTIKTLQAEYEMLITEKKKAYSEYAVARKEMKELLTAKMNIDRLLGGVRKQPERKQEHHG